MMYASFSTIALALLLGTASAQNVTVASTCTTGFTAGRDVAVYSLPYTYDQVMSVIGSYQNLTWAGDPGNVTLNGTDNTVGTARSYDVAGNPVVETILVYSKPPAPGPYQEVHNTATFSLPNYNVTLYFPYDSTIVTSICGGKAVTFNFTTNFCSTNVAAANEILQYFHINDAVTAGKFLGGQNFTSCEALGVPNATSTGAPPVATYKGSTGRMSPASIVTYIAWTCVLMVAVSQF